MMVSVQEEMFSAIYAETRNAVLAWRKAFLAPEEISDLQIREAANKLVKEPRIQIRVAQHRLNIVEKNEVTTSKLLTMAMAIHDKALQSNKTLSTALKAVELMAKLTGAEKPEEILPQEDVIGKLAFLLRRKEQEAITVEYKTKEDLV